VGDMLGFVIVVENGDLEAKITLLVESIRRLPTFSDYPIYVVQPRRGKPPSRRTLDFLANQRAVFVLNDLNRTWRHHGPMNKVYASALIESWVERAVDTFVFLNRTGRGAQAVIGQTHIQFPSVTAFGSICKVSARNWSPRRRPVSLSRGRSPLHRPGRARLPHRRHVDVVQIETIRVVDDLERMVSCRKAERGSGYRLPLLPATGVRDGN
jgi:hypothetical protein